MQDRGCGGGGGLDAEEGESTRLDRGDLCRRQVMQQVGGSVDQVHSRCWLCRSVWQAQ